MRKVIAILFLAILLAGCKKNGEPITPVDSRDDYRVEFLFEVDGIKVYRFIDKGCLVYFTNKSSNVEYTHSVSNGKTTTSSKVQTLCNENTETIQ